MLIFIQIPPPWPCPVCWLLFLFIAGTALELLRLNVGNKGGPDTIKTNGQMETSGVPLYRIRVSSLCIFHNLWVSFLSWAPVLFVYVNEKGHEQDLVRAVSSSLETR